MKYYILPLIAISFIAACTNSKTSAVEPDLVKTTAGWIKGSTNSDSTVYVYKGVPFAAPPVGDLRWKEPQPLKPWTDTLNTISFGASPIQNNPVPFMMWSQEFITPAKPLSEDCLFLNVWTPKPANSTNAKLPVLVWIHGGGFTSGSGACPIYDGEALAKEGIVYVSINYRLGVFGFMAHPQLTKESSHNASGNYALLDQIAALEWIKNNIAQFGGDPNRVTIAGQSAGSMAVQSVVASPLAKGLIAGAIAESGGLGARPVRTLSEAEKTGTMISQKIKSDNINDLRNLPADSILALANTLPFGTFAPIVDGYFLPEDPNEIFSKGRFNDVPLLAGWVTGDADLAVRQPKTPAEFKSFAKQTYGGRSEDFLKLFPASNDETSLSSQRKLGTLHFAGLPNYRWITASKSKGYMYEFNYVPTDKPGFPNYGAFHTSEVPFALRTLSYWDRPWTDTDQNVERYLSSYWINFVKTGDPNGADLPPWPAYNVNDGSVMQFGEMPEVKPALYKGELEFLSVKL
jgi:para-nitrobenzyl esterase